MVDILDDDFSTRVEPEVQMSSSGAGVDNKAGSSSKDDSPPIVESQKPSTIVNHPSKPDERVAAVKRLASLSDLMVGCRAVDTHNFLGEGESRREVVNFTKDNIFNPSNIRDAYRIISQSDSGKPDQSIIRYSMLEDQKSKIAFLEALLQKQQKLITEIEKNKNIENIPERLNQTYQEIIHSLPAVQQSVEAIQSELQKVRLSDHFIFRLNQVFSSNVIEPILSVTEHATQPILSITDLLASYLSTAVEFVGSDLISPAIQEIKYQTGWLLSQPTDRVSGLRESPKLEVKVVPLDALDQGNDQENIWKSPEASRYRLESKTIGPLTEAEELFLAKQLVDRLVQMALDSEQHPIPVINFNYASSYPGALEEMTRYCKQQEQVFKEKFIEKYHLQGMDEKNQLISPFKFNVTTRLLQVGETFFPSQTRTQDRDSSDTVKPEGSPSVTPRPGAPRT